MSEFKIGDRVLRNMSNTHEVGTINRRSLAKEDMWWVKWDGGASAWYAPSALKPAPEERPVYELQVGDIAELTEAYGGWKVGYRFEIVSIYRSRISGPLLQGKHIQVLASRCKLVDDAVPDEGTVIVKVADLKIVEGLLMSVNSLETLELVQSYLPREPEQPVEVLLSELETIAYSGFSAPGLRKLIQRLKEQGK